MVNKSDLAAHLALEMADPLSWWWVSFIDPNLPRGAKFVGGYIVQGKGKAHVHQACIALGASDTWEPAFMRIRWSAMQLVRLDERNRRLTRSESEAIQDRARYAHMRGLRMPR